MEIHTQPTLWRLYTDTRFRKEFLFDKHSFYQKYEISEDIIHFLEDTPIQELAYFADTLLHKRMHKVRAFLPLTFKLIGKDTQMLFFKFCDYYTPTGIHRHQDDASEFVHYLLRHKTLAIHLRLNRYVRSILLFEQHQVMDETGRALLQPKIYGHDQLPHARLKSRRKKKTRVQKFHAVEEWIKKARMRSHHLWLK